MDRPSNEIFDQGRTYGGDNYGALLIGPYSRGVKIEVKARHAAQDVAEKGMAHLHLWVNGAQIARLERRDCMEWDFHVERTIHMDAFSKCDIALDIGHSGTRPGVYSLTATVSPAS